MTLAGLIAFDRDALTCDLAETYGIYGWEHLPPKLVATLAAGLRENSRILKKISGSKQSLEVQLLAQILDGINALIWGRGMLEEKPSSVYDALMAGEPHKPEIKTFETENEFIEAWEAITGTKRNV